MPRRRFENTTPIDDPLVVLDLLCRRWNDNTTRSITRYFQKQDGLYVEIGHHPDFSASRYRRFRITDRVVDDLLARGYIEGTPGWGYTDMKLLRASGLGDQQLWQERSRLHLSEQLCSEWWYAEMAESTMIASKELAGEGADDENT